MIKDFLSWLTHTYLDQHGYNVLKGSVPRTVRNGFATLFPASGYCERNIGRKRCINEQFKSRKYNLQMDHRPLVRLFVSILLNRRTILCTGDGYLQQRSAMTKKETILHALKE